jgi:hypothetical protein
VLAQKIPPRKVQGLLVGERGCTPGFFEVGAALLVYPWWRILRLAAETLAGSPGLIPLAWLAIEPKVIETEPRKKS